MIYGANIRLWCFADKTRPDTLAAQVDTCKRAGWRYIRDNSTEMGKAWSGGRYSDDVEGEQVAALTRAGLKVILTIADANPWLDDCVTNAQRAALMVRYRGNVLDVRRAISAIGQATNMENVVDGICRRATAMYARYATNRSVWAERENGGEGTRWRGGPWDVLSDGFMRDMRALGFPFPANFIPLVLRQSIVRSNLSKVQQKIAAIWNDRLLGGAMHLYDWGYQVHQLGETSRIVTEFGASINEGPERADRLANLLTAWKGKTDMMLLHSPLDSRFMQTFFNGTTAALWDATEYERLLVANQQQPAEYDGLLPLDSNLVARLGAIASA